MATVKCTKCGRKIENVTGGIVKCPDCGHTMKFASSNTNTQSSVQGTSKMPTKKCKHCKSDIPYDAKVCPQCRRKQGGGCLKPILICFAVICIIGVIAGMSENKPKKVEKQDSDTEQVTANAEDNLKTETEEKDTFTIGETAEMNDVQVTMLDYSENSGSEWNEPADGNIFILVEFEIQNNSDSELTVSSALSFEAYADDYAANVSFGALMENEQNQLDGTIAPGKKMRGWVGYEVPTEWKNLEIHFTDNVWSSDKFKFEIAK